MGAWWAPYVTNTCAGLAIMLVLALGRWIWTTFARSELRPRLVHERRMMTLDRRQREREAMMWDARQYPRFAQQLRGMW